VKILSGYLQQPHLTFSMPNLACHSFAAHFAVNFCATEIFPIRIFQGQITETTIEIPHSQHATLQGPKGQILRAVRDECGGILIRFPAANVQSDKVLLRGPPEDVEKAKKLLLDLASDRVRYANGEHLLSYISEYINKFDERSINSSLIFFLRNIFAFRIIMFNGCPCIIIKINRVSVSGR
jgi:hypothetical protein